MVLALGAAGAACGGGSSRSAPGSTSPTGPADSQPTTTATSGPPTTRAPSTTEPTPPPALPEGPAYPFDFPDPYVLARGDHVAVATTSGRLQLQALQAADLTSWEGPTDALAAMPRWSSPFSAWAPAILEVDGRFLLYYTAQVAGTDQHCISVARSPTPEGPFIDDRAEPLLCPQDLGGAIDPSPFVDRDGRRYLLWKNDGVTLRRESRIWAQPLSEDGERLTGDAVALIATDQAWEAPHVEAPSMALVEGTYWLAYSGNWWDQDAYGIGLARCDSVTGPCEKPFDGPVLASAPGRFGPGGGEFFRDVSGRLLLAYHAWLDEPGYPGNRALHLAEVLLDGGVLTLHPRP